VFDRQGECAVERWSQTGVPHATAPDASDFFRLAVGLTDEVLARGAGAVESERSSQPECRTRQLQTRRTFSGLRWRWPTRFSRAARSRASARANRSAARDRSRRPDFLRPCDRADRRCRKRRARRCERCNQAFSWPEAHRRAVLGRRRFRDRQRVGGVRVHQTAPHGPERRFRLAVRGRRRDDRRRRNPRNEQ